MNKEAKLKPAKVCFSHIGGKLGTLLLQAFEEKGWIAKQDPANKHFLITEKGERAFTRLGIDLSLIKAEAL